MKKHGIINAQLAGLIAGLGHTDLFMVVDGGMPVPKGIEVVDLALCGGVPTFEQVLDAVLNEAVIEYFYLAEEILDKNERLHRYILQSMEGTQAEYIPHTDLKEFSKEVKFAIRTGEFTPYPNIILRAGVSFQV